MYYLEKMEVDQDVIKIATGTTITCQKNVNQINTSKKTGQDCDVVIIDTSSSESSSDGSDGSDVEVVNQYKLEDIRPIIGKFGK